MWDYFDSKGLQLELLPNVKVSKKGNRVEEEGDNNKGKCKEKVIEKKMISRCWKEWFASNLLLIVQKIKARR